MKHFSRIITDIKACDAALAAQFAREAEQLAGADRDTPGKPQSQPPPERCPHGTLIDHCPDCAP